MPIHRLGPSAGAASSQQVEAKRNDADARTGRVSHEKKPGALATLKQALSRLAAALTGKEARATVAAKSGSEVFSVRDFSRLEIALFTEAQMDHGPPAPTDVPVPHDAPPPRPQHLAGPPPPTDVPVPPDAPPSPPRYQGRPPPTDTPPPLPSQTPWKSATPTKPAAPPAKPVSAETRETQRKYDLDAQMDDLEAMIEKSQADRRIDGAQHQLDAIEQDLQDLIQSGPPHAAGPPG